MTSNLKPETPDAVVEAVAWAAAEETPLEVVGAGSRRDIGRPVQAEYTLNLSALTGVTLYEPEELVLSAMAGTPIAEIEALLAEGDRRTLGRVGHLSSTRDTYRGDGRPAEPATD